MFSTKKRASSAGKVISTLLAAILISGILIPSTAVEAKSDAKIEIYPAATRLHVNRTEMIYLEKDGKKVKKGVKFSSSNKKVATVNSKGLMKAIKAGKAMISVKYKGEEYKCELTVLAENGKSEKLYSSIEKVASDFRNAYGRDMLKSYDGKDFVNKKSRSYGIINVVNGNHSGDWTSPEESYKVTYRILEMDMNSKQYKKLKV